MILLIDNYDSFTHNLFQAFRKLGREVAVRRNDALTVEEAAALSPDAVVISPGPGTPETAGISVPLIRALQGRVPILGVCLGHQSIAAAFGGEIVPAAELVHGRDSEIHHDGKGIFSGIGNPFRAVRYHSLAVSRPALPPDLEISAWTDEGEIMGLRHTLYSIDGVQFHPESIGTESGLQILSNFLAPPSKPSPLQTAIRTVMDGKDLDAGEAEIVMEDISSGRATQTQVACLLTALSWKGESVSEITGFARVLRRKAVPIPRSGGDGPLLDTCGTGGDGRATFNISTCAALVAAGAGVTVAKHGNRSVTSRCGSADLLEALGVNVTVPPEVMGRSLEEAGMAFLFAPRLHPSMKFAVPVRAEIGIRTIFNILGPLANPAGADIQILGVFQDRLRRKMAESLVRLGVRRAMVVHGEDGTDEITLCGATRVSEVRDGWIRDTTIRPEDAGLAPCRPEDVPGGDLRTNCDIVLGVLGGAPGPARDVVVLNTAAAIMLAGLAPDLREGARRAEAAIDDGSAMKKLEALVAVTNR
ncbi:MAG: bifunctional anthranilate synthase component II/anthranilate phosphoribosyltransferase [Acidobacteriota bacterium]|nr:bifunctional anthranilate synthase component II/anthranilate phosphoribosyltransferase [Acidobacteriota bacterium]